MAGHQIYGDLALYFVTFTIVDWLPVFITEETCKIIVDSFNFCRENKYLRTNGFVIMPSHTHALVFDAEFDSERLRKTLGDMRKHTGKKLIEYCADHMPLCYTETFKRAAGKDREFQFWKKKIYPEAVYTEKFYRQKLDYIHDNPRRKGLVRKATDWRFSSAAFWLDEGETDIILTLVQF